MIVLQKFWAEVNLFDLHTVLRNIYTLVSDGSGGRSVSFLMFVSNILDALKKHEDIDYKEAAISTVVATTLELFQDEQTQERLEVSSLDAIKNRFSNSICPFVFNFRLVTSLQLSQSAGFFKAR